MKNRRNENSKIKSLIIVAIVVLSGVGIAYAAMQTSLTLTVNKVTQSALTWNVAFSGSSVTPTPGGTSDTGRTCGNAAVTATTVTVADTTLSKPGDKCTYTLTVNNSGGIAAKLAAITPTKPTGTSVTCGTATNGTLVCGNITYKLTSDSAGSTELPLNTTIAAGGTQTIYLVVSYTASGLQSSAITQTGASFALRYDQA